MDVSIILVNYNTKQLAKECIQSIYEKTHDLSFEIIMIDNNSSDGSVEAIKQSFPDVIIIANPKNSGFGSANNLGIKISKGKYVLLLNTDTILINNAIKELFDFIEKNEECAVVGGNLFDKDMKEVHSYGFLDNPKDNLLKIIGLKCLLKNKKNDSNRIVEQEVEQVIGADMLIRKKVLDQVGLFDERFFLYREESELQHRIRQAGYKIFYTPEAKIYHLEGASTKKNKKFRRQTIAQSEFLYFSLCYPSVPLIALRILCTLPQLYRLFSAPTYTLKALKYIWTTSPM